MIFRVSPRPLRASSLLPPFRRKGGGQFTGEFMHVALEAIRTAVDNDDLSSFLAYNDVLCESEDWPAILEILRYTTSRQAERHVFAEIAFRGFARRFEKREDAEDVLYRALEESTDEALICNLIQTLGVMRSKRIFDVVKRFMSSESDDIRFKCIISLGWSESADAIAILQERLCHDPMAWLRGMTSTAMRQLFYSNPELKDSLVPILYEALISEKDELAASMIIGSLQTIMKMNFGIRERTSANTYSGNLARARLKVKDAMIKQGYSIES